MPPKSRAFHRIAREVLAPELADHGFSRPPAVGPGIWARPQGGDWLVLWTQFYRWNYGDAPDGYRFIVEAQLNAVVETGGRGPRARLYRLLSDEQRLAHLAIYNHVAAKLRPNPDLLGMGDEYVSDLRPRSEPFPWDEDVWFRYVDEDDVRRWLDFVATVLPGAIDRFLAAASDQRGRRPRPGDLLW